MGGVHWTERFPVGWLSLEQTDFNQAMLEGRREGATIHAQLSLAIDDIDRFVASPLRQARVATGFLQCPKLGGHLEVRGGVFELFVPSSALFDLLHLRMRYRLNMRDTEGRKLRLYGFKMIEDDPGSDIWADTTTLFVRVHSGWWAVEPDAERPAADAAEPQAGPNPGPEHPGEEDDPAHRHDCMAAANPEHDCSLLATGVMRITPSAFLRQLVTFTGTASSAGSQRADILRFGWCFFGEGLAKVYLGRPIADGRPSFPEDDRPTPWGITRSGPEWHAVPGREKNEQHAGRLALERDIVPFRVDDLEFPLNLHHIRPAGDENRTGDPVLLVPGSGVRAELFYGQPVGRTIVDSLLVDDHGYDVWVENWRASIDFPNNSYTLDQAARLDHPRAVQTVFEQTGKRIRAVVHCQGSISFVLAAMQGLFEDRVSHIVSSAISLFFEVPYSTWLKQRTLLPVVRRFGTGADPQWGIRAAAPVAKVIAQFSQLAERPCHNVPCQIANFIYGSGWDVLLLHDNVDDRVHAWSARELGYTPFSLIGQVAESCRTGHIVPAEPRDPLTPPSYMASRPNITDTRFTFICGTHNRMFHPEGQQRSAEYLRMFGIDAEFVPLPGYGHLDTFWGRDAARDVFPHILDGLKRGGGGPAEMPPIPEGRAPRFGVLRRDQRWLPRRFSPPPSRRARVLPRCCPAPIGGTPPAGPQGGSDA